MGVMSMTGCGKAADGDKTSSSTSALSARAQLPGGDDVGSILFTVQPVDCTSGAPTGPAIVQNVPLEDQLIPGNTGLANNPLDKDSAHSFADFFKVVPAGCYNVTTAPLQPDGSPSKICASAFKNGVVVVQGQTTEIFLLNQCAGTDPGAIDVISALNHAPILDDVKFTDSKFACGQPAQVCLAGHDVDSDPLQFTLTAQGCDVTPAGDPQGSPATGESQCFSINCHSFGPHTLVATVYDLIWRNGQLIRIEDWLAQEGYPNPSHGQLEFHIYVDGVKYYPDKDGDGHGDPAGPVQIVCPGAQPPAGYVLSNDDCNDNDATAYPGHAEVCRDGVDNNCDGQVDEGCTNPDPECAGQTCGTFTTCNPGGSCGFNGVCGSTASGGGLCIDGSTLCAGLADCAGGACAGGSICFVNSCCGRPVCVPPSQFCSNTESPSAPPLSSPANGPTIAGGN